MNIIDIECHNVIVSQAYLCVEEYEKSHEKKYKIDESEISLLVNEIVDEIDKRYDKTFNDILPNLRYDFEEQLTAIVATQMRSISCTFKINYIIECVIGHFIMYFLDEEYNNKKTIQLLRKMKISEINKKTYEI